jgi:hypothetical protein
MVSILMQHYIQQRLAACLKRPATLVATALLMSACATPTPTSTTPVTARSQPPASTQKNSMPVPEGQDAFRAIVSQQARLYRVAAPLLTKNITLCKANARNLLGFSAKNKYSYPTQYRDTAQKLLGLDEQLEITQVLADSGAALMGLQAGDKLLSVNNRPFPQGPNAERQAAEILLPFVSNQPSIKLTVTHDGKDILFNIPLTRACAFAVELGNLDNVNAYADGRRILITRGMMNFVQTDDELAYVLAKEIAHNTLNHAKKQKMNATIGGVIDKLISSQPDPASLNGTAGIKPYPQTMDISADSLSLYMVARAGYNVDNLIPFWQRLASQYPATVLSSYTALHPATASRLSAMEKTLSDIKLKQDGKKPLLP